jgi:tRNA A37 threonylcarbamoyladenosine biosynthesis protein TsaE
MDLYRLPGRSPKDFEPLDLPHVFSNCISLIEWPSRLQTFPELLPPEQNTLQIDIRIVPSSEERTMKLTTNDNSSWKDRLQYLIDEEMVDDLLIQDTEDDDKENLASESTQQGNNKE